MADILRNIVTTILTIIFFITLMLMIVILNVSHFFTSENITKGVLQMDISKALNEMENSDASGSQITEILDNAYIVAGYYGVSSDVIDEMVNDKAIKQFFGMTAGNMTDYVINGTENKVLTSEEFNKILDDNIDSWIEKSNVDVTDKQKEQFLDTVKSESGQIIDNLPTTSQIANKLEISNFDKITTIFNIKTKIIIASILLISMILILILKRKEFRNVIYLGYTCLIAGILTVGIGLISNDLITIVLSKSGIFLDVSLFGNMLMKQFIITGICFILISIVFYIIYLILRKKANV